MEAHKKALLILLFIYNCSRDTFTSKHIQTRMFRKQDTNTDLSEPSLQETFASSIIECIGKCLQTEKCKTVLLEETTEERKNCFLKGQGKGKVSENSDVIYSSYTSGGQKAKKIYYGEYEPDLQYMKTDYKDFSGKFLSLKLLDDPVDYATAEKLCNEDDAILAPYIVDMDSNYFQKEIAKVRGLHYGNLAWIGVDDRRQEGNFTLSNGTWGYNLKAGIPWAKFLFEEPNEYYNKDCGCIVYEFVYVCSYNSWYRFVCEYVQDPNNVTEGYQEFQGKYYSLVEDKLYYDDAVKRCQDENAILASAFNPDKKILTNFLAYSDVSNDTTVWVGLEDQKEEGFFILSNGLNITDLDKMDIDWYGQAAQNPDGGTSYNCASLVARGYDDIYCTTKLPNIICEYFGRSAGREKTTMGSEVDGNHALKYAVDGKYDVFYDEGSGTVLKALESSESWFMIDFSESYLVWKVKISFNTGTDYYEMKGFQIRIGNEKDSYKDNDLCYNFDDQFPYFSTQVLICDDSPLEGRYVVLHTLEVNSVIFLTELDVYGYPLSKYKS